MPWLNPIVSDIADSAFSARESQMASAHARRYQRFVPRVEERSDFGFGSIGLGSE
jgi:hypothetical protein